MNTPSHISPVEAVMLSLEGEAAPDWVQLLPAVGKPFRPIDGRGPWSYDDAEALIAASFAATPRIFIDINHSTLRAGPKGGDAPAVGQIVEMQAREDGIWGRVEWSRKGAELMADKAYHGISPVIVMDTQNKSKVARIWHASLTNTPALGGAIASLSEEIADMNMAAIAKALGLAEDADEEAILAAIAKLTEAKSAPVEEMTALATALGAEAGASIQQLTVLAHAAKAQAGDADRVETLAAQIEEMQAKSWLDAKLAEGCGIPAAAHEQLMAIHRDDPAGAETLAASFPRLSVSHTAKSAPKSAGKVEALSADQKMVANQLGVSHADFLAQLNADANAEGAV